MHEFTGVAYDPPHEGFPFLAVVFAPDGRVIFTKPATSREEAEKVLAEISGTIESAIDEVSRGGHA